MSNNVIPNITLLDMLLHFMVFLYFADYGFYVQGYWTKHIFLYKMSDFSIYFCI